MAEFSQQVQDSLRECSGLRIAISGSRDLDPEAAFYHIHAAFKSVDWPVGRIHHGGADGVDEAAEWYADWQDIPVFVWHPDWDEHGKSAGPIRNRRMIRASDALIAVRLNDSPGTTDAIQKSYEFNLKQHIIDIST